MRKFTPAVDATTAGVAPDHADPEVYVLCLFVAGQSAKSLTAIANLKKICDEHLPGRCQTEVIDLMIYPQRAREDEIVAIPTLVRKKPLPEQRIIGDLFNTETVLAALDLKARTQESAD